MKADTSFSSLEINKHSQGFYPQDQKIERKYLAHRLVGLQLRDVLRNGH